MPARDVKDYNWWQFMIGKRVYSRLLSIISFSLDSRIVRWFNLWQITLSSTLVACCKIKDPIQVSLEERAEKKVAQLPSHSFVRCAARNVFCRTLCLIKWKIIQITLNNLMLLLFQILRKYMKNKLIQLCTKSTFDGGGGSKQKFIQIRLFMFRCESTSLC